MATQSRNVDFYDESYKRENYFRYRRLLYRPYVSSLVSYCGLQQGATLLDVGCGQGFFSALFRRHGLRVFGVDISEMGIRTALHSYGHSGITFTVGDVRLLEFPHQFDCIFVRSCSLYNTDSFSWQRDVTDGLLKHLRIGGTLIFTYNSTLSSRPSTGWRHHSIRDAQLHFCGYPNLKVFYITKLTPLLLRTYSFSTFATRLSILLTKVTGTGGELVCVLKKAT